LAPWWNEKLDKSTPPALRILRGDFFCLPFGGNSRPFGKERHPVHGETANNRWKLNSYGSTRRATTIACSMATKVRKGRVDKQIELRHGEHTIYQRHTISNMTGPMCLGHHAMLRFPDVAGSGVLSVSPFKLGQTWLQLVERPEDRGYSMLKPAAEFTSLECVPTVFGDNTDLARYPARRGYEDLVLLAADDTLPFAWSAVVFPTERYVWFSVRDPKILASTVLWLSNGGRHYPPSNGRHVNVLGIEDVTSFFHPGLAESAADNPLTRRGIKTTLSLNPRKPLVVNHIMAVADLPQGFDRVADIVPGDGSVTLVSRNGTSMKVPLDLSWLRSRA
ncbi:MAG TPA: hypothetical protein PLD59_05950, partial [Tepidisphaeraceae bacterium]|nr:hypothetical protein [Tepidisphaeraceae bacterium]